MEASIPTVGKSTSQHLGSRSSRLRLVQLCIKPQAEPAWRRPTPRESRRSSPKRIPPHAALHYGPSFSSHSWRWWLRRATWAQGSCRRRNRLSSMARSVPSYDPGRSVSRVNVAVAVAEDACGRIYEVAAACRALGLEHTSTLADVGVLTGSVEFHDLPKLRAIPDVVAVELEGR